MAERRIKVIEVKEVKLESGHKFNAFTGVDKSGKKITIKFRRDCKNVPEKPCCVIVDDNDFNLDTSRQYPCIWVNKILRTEELYEARQNKHADMFEDANLEPVSNDEELPL